MVDRAPRGDKVVLMSDLYARVGNNVARWEGVTGKQGEHVENSNRTLLSFSAVDGFKILSTYYEHKEICTYTRKCPVKGLQSITDYFLVRGVGKEG